MCLALLAGATIILAGMWKAKRSSYVTKAIVEA
jgi:hypothetical protein